MSVCRVLTGGTGLKIVNAILEDLRKDTSLLEIREKYRSQSQIYEAIRQYLDEADKAIDDRRVRILEADAELGRMKGEVRDLQNTREKISEDVLKMQAESDRLARQNDAQAEMKLRFEKEIDDLSVKG
jgi:chromosome segregation ATPase